MFRYLLVLEIAVAVLGASMVIGVGVSALLLAWHLDTAPEQRASMQALLVLTAAYSAMTLTAAAGAWALHRQARWHWLAHAGFVITLVLAYLFSIRMLASQ